MHKTIKVFTAFSGYDSQMMALNRVADRHKDEISFDLVGWSEMCIHLLVIPTPFANLDIY